MSVPKTTNKQMFDDEPISRSERRYSTDIPQIDIEPEEHVLFHLRPIKETVDESTEKEPPHRHTFQEIIWIKSGSGKHSIDDQVLKISTRTFYLIPQGQVHKFIHGRNLIGYVIQFTNDFLLDLPVDQTWVFRTSLFSSLASEHRISVPKAQIDDFDMLLDQIVTEYARDPEFGKYQILRHLLNVLLIRIQRVKDRASAGKEESYTDERDVFQRFLELLEEKYRSIHNVFVYAENLSVPSRRLSSVTKRFTGKTAKEILSDRLVLEAKRYLAYSSLSVKEIAFTLGFDDPSHFSKTFKKVTRLSPLEFKSQVKTT